MGRNCLAFHTALFDVPKTPHIGLQDLKLQTEQMLEETDEKIFHQNMVFQHLVDRMAMVEYLTDAGDELENKWVASVNKLWRGTNE